MDLFPFQMAVQVRDIAEARHFYREVLGCMEGRSDPRSVGFNLYGHQIVCHLNPRLGTEGRISSNYTPPDGHGVPIPHCGIVLEINEWNALAERLKQHRAEFLCEPYVVRYNGARGERATLLLLDPSGNAVQFKSLDYSAEQLFRGKQKKRLCTWMFWAIPTAFVVCWILLQGKKSVDDIAAGDFAVPAQVPPCASRGSCEPKP
jgi:extradiol dioxygenase family protein